MKYIVNFISSVLRREDVRSDSSLPNSEGLGCLQVLGDKFTLKAGNKLRDVTSHKNSTFIVAMAIIQSDLSCYSLAYSMQQSPS